MAKDPAFLFYPGDYLKDTQCLNELQQVAYDRIMCEHMRNICEHMNNIGVSQGRLNFFTKSLSEHEKKELLTFLQECEAGFQIEWVALSISKRKYYTNSRAKNRSKKTKNISSSYDKHMVNENENEIDNKIESEKIKEIGSEKIKEIANKVWKDEIWKEQVCIGMGIEKNELKKWLALFNSSIASDSITGFGIGNYKKMSKGWIISKKSQGMKIPENDIQKKTDSAPLKILNGV